MRRYILFFPIFILVLLWCRCDSGKGESPAETLVKVYQAANDGWYSVAEQHIYSEVLKTVKQYQGSLYIIGEWDKYTKYGQIERIEIVKEMVRGERAEVSFKIHFKDGEIKEDRDLLLKEDRLWKIMFDFAR